jgi:integrase
MFYVAIDSKLRGSDVVALKVEDAAPNGYAVDRATVRQKKTGQPVRFELTEQTRQAIDEYQTLPGRSLERPDPESPEPGTSAALCGSEHRAAERCWRRLDAAARLGGFVLTERAPRHRGARLRLSG